MDYFGFRPWEVEKINIDMYKDLFIYIDIKSFLERKNNNIETNYGRRTNTN